MARWVTSCFGSLEPWPLLPAVPPQESSALECVAKAPSFKDGAVLSLSPLRWPAPQELVDSLVAFLPKYFEATLSRLGEPSLSIAFVKSSASTLAGGRMPTVIVKIKPAGVNGVSGCEMDELHIFYLFIDSQMVLISPPLKYSALPGVLTGSSFDGGQFLVVVSAEF